MSLLQIKKQPLLTILAFLIIALLGFHKQVQAESTDKSELAQSLWEDGTNIYNSVNIAFREEGYQPALKKFTDSLALYKEVGDRQSEADVLTWIAKVYLDIGDGSKFTYAKNCLEQAQYIYNELNSSPGKKASIKYIDTCMEAMSLYIIGENYLDGGDKDSALEKFNAAVQMLSKIGERFYEARILLKIGNVYDFDLHNSSEAERSYQEALAIFRELRNKGFEGVVLAGLGRVLYHRNDDSKAIEYLNESLSIFEQLNDTERIASCLLWKGLISLRQNNYDMSKRFFEEALEIHKETEDKKGAEGKKLTANLSLSVAYSYNGMGYIEKPIEYFEQALITMQETGKDPRETRVIYLIGNLYSKMGNYQEALKILNKAMRIYKKNKDSNNQGEVLIDIGIVNMNLGNYLNAIDNLKRALEIFEGVSDSDLSKRQAFSILRNVYKLLGDDETAKEYDLDNEGTDKADSLWKQGREAYNVQMESYFHTPEPGQDAVRQGKDYLPIIEKFNNSLYIYRKNGDRQSEADLLTWLARAYLDIGKYADAFKCLKESNDIYEVLNSSPGEKASVKDIKKAMKAMFYFVTAKEYEEKGDLKTALAKSKATLKLLKKMGERLYEAYILMNIGSLNYELERFVDAERYTEQALSIVKELGGKGNEGRIQYNLAVLYYRQDNIIKSFEHIDNALKIFEQFNDESGMLISLAWKGYVHYYQNDYTKALDFYKQAQAYLKGIENKKIVAEIDEKIGDVHKGMGYFNIPLTYYKQALNIMQEVGGDPREGEILYTIGQMYCGMGDYENALKAYSKAMQIYKGKNSMVDQGEVLVEVGKVNSKQGDYTKAIENIKKALKIFDEIKDPAASKDAVASKSLALIAIEEVYRLLGDNESAKEYNSTNKNMDKPKNKAKWSQWFDLQSLGYSLAGEKKYEKALNVFLQSLDLGKEINVSYERQSLTNIGYVYKILANYTEALSFYNQALRVSREHNAKGQELATLLLIATIYDYPWLSDYSKALDYYEQALSIAKEIGDWPSEEKCLSSIGQIYMDQVKDKESEKYYLNALKLNSKMGAQEKICQIQNKLGLLAYLSGDSQKAKNYYIESIKTVESIRGNIAVEEYKTSFIEDKLSIYTDLIYLLLELKENEEAFNYVERVKSRSLLDLLGNRLKLKKGKGKELSQEEKRLQKKINEILGKMRSEHSESNDKQRKVLKKRNKDLEKARKQYAKYLLKLKEQNPELHSLVSVNPLTLKEVQGLIDHDTTLLEYYAIESELDGSPILYVVIWVIDKTDSKIVIKALTDPSSLSELASWISSFREKITTLQPDYQIDAEVLYDFFIGSVKPYIKTKRICIIPYSVFHYLPFHALVNSPEKSGIGAMIDINNEMLTIDSTVEGSSAYKVGLNSGDKIIEIDGDSTINMSLQEAVSRLRGELYTTVLLTIEEVGSQVRKKVELKREIIAKSNDYSKFVAGDTKRKKLKDPNFLIEEYDIFYAPSASVLKFVLEKRKEASGKVLAFGNPELENKDLDLPYAEEEVKRIKESYPDTSIYINEKATEEKAKQLSGDYEIIHFASHGELSPQSPLFSCIKMAKDKDEDGRLEVHEIFNLDLEDTSLVTLSACQTGLGKLSKGDELIGLTRGFIYAGTPSVVASLWSVNDQSTSDLMSLFYKNLKTHSKVESLRMAQLEMINGEAGRGIVRGVGGITASVGGEQPQTTVNGSHPYFWAPFILLGDWN